MYKEISKLNGYQQGFNVMEWVSLVASGIQFFTRHTAVFAEKVGEMFVGIKSGSLIQSTLKTFVYNFYFYTFFE